MKTRDKQALERPPIFETGITSIGPTGATFYSGDVLPLQGDLVFCNFNFATLLRIEAAEIDRVLNSPALDMVAVRDTEQPCSLDVAMSPDGALYLSDTGSIYRWGP